MAFESISEKIGRALKKLRSKGKLTESDIKEVMKEVRIALLEADVNFKIAKDFVADVTEKAVGKEILESLTPAQQIIKIVDEELTKLMGSASSRLSTTSRPPLVIMMCGLQGSGKTTHCGKLAKKLIKEGKRPLLVACDIYRPAAIKQLEVVSAAAGANFFQCGTDPIVKTAKAAIAHAKDYGNDVVIIDTAGRLHIDEALMNELKGLKKEIIPHEILLVVDAMTGQDAVNVSKSFDEALGIDGVVLTKTDGDARGGAALSVKAVTGKPIKFIGNGEKLEDLEEFHPDRIASRILGMGDMLSLIEKAESEFDEKKAVELEQKLMKNKFDFNDLYGQLEQMKKMGSIGKILGMIPGMAGKVDTDNIDEKEIYKGQHIINSMTKKEREKPSVIDHPRKKRIAAGSGTQVQDVNRLLKQLEQMQTMFKRFNGKKKGKKFGDFGNPGGFPF